jgi:hypothetical protein
VEIDVASVPVFGNSDGTAVNTYRCIFRQLWRFGIERLEFITVIGIDCRSETLYFPVSRYRDVLPSLLRRRSFGDVSRKLFVGICVIKLPGSVQQLVVRTFFVISRQCLRLVGISHESRTGFFSVNGNHLDIFPVGKRFICLDGLGNSDGCQSGQ